MTLETEIGGLNFRSFLFLNIFVLYLKKKTKYTKIIVMTFWITSQNKMENFIPQISALII